ncbi:hypothetical protein LTR37_015235 [Vermiconidia calcicola]|uniref:Uncharacterized protein n=1 Tax=Vermiconidia calcicola TaxID=1690605 RepID=A0ACC3MRW3_9PEZI|nr:hypothetical protein LTR37_015235 [Vermiconidia calcicola]
MYIPSPPSSGGGVVAVTRVVGGVGRVNATKDDEGVELDKNGEEGEGKAVDETDVMKVEADKETNGQGVSTKQEDKEIREGLEIAKNEVSKTASKGKETMKLSS